MASAGFDPMTSAKNVEHLHHSGYVWFLVCVVRFWYLNLRKFIWAQKVFSMRQGTWGVCYNSNPQIMWSSWPSPWGTEHPIQHALTHVFHMYRMEEPPRGTRPLLTTFAFLKTLVMAFKVGLYGYYYNMVLTILKANKRVCHFKGIFKYFCYYLIKSPTTWKPTWRSGNQGQDRQISCNQRNPWESCEEGQANLYKPIHFQFPTHALEWRLCS